MAERKIADVQVGERVAVRVRGEWQRWAKVLRVTATQIVTTGPSKLVPEERWQRAAGREKGQARGSGVFHWSEIALLTPRDEAWAARQRALFYVEQALTNVREIPEHRWVDVPEAGRDALDRMGKGARDLTLLLAKEG